MIISTYHKNKTTLYKKDMKKFKAALFDLDGTLVDTESQYSVFWGKMGKKYHPEIPYFDQLIKGTTLPDIYQKYFPEKETQDTITPLLYAWEAEMDYPFIKGAEEFIIDLRSKGVKCAVVTSSNEDKLNSLRKKTPVFDDYFDLILTSEMFSKSKPDPECYLMAARLFGFEKSECMVFEDAINGLQAGKSSGILTVGLTTTNSAERISGLCDLIVNDFTELSYDRLESLL